MTPADFVKSRAFHAGSAVVSGALSGAALPGVFDFSPLAFVAMIPLYIALTGASALWGMFLGWLAGVFFICAGAWWLPVSVVNLAGVSIWKGILVLLAAAMTHGVQVGIASWVHCRLTQHKIPRWLSFSVSFAAAEALFPQVLPCTTAVQIHSIPELIQIADLFGTGGITLMLMCVNASIAEFIINCFKDKCRKTSIRSCLVLAPGIISVVVSLFYCAVRVPKIDARQQNAPVSKIAIIQGGMTGMEKIANLQKIAERHVTLSAQILKTEEVDFFVWGESAIPGGTGPGLIRNNLRKLFEGVIDRPVILGIPIQDNSYGTRQHYNAAVIAQSDGWICPTCRYNKQQLFPIGEYLPDFLASQTSPEESKVMAGGSSTPLSFQGHTIGVFICYEAINASLVHKIATTDDVELLINLAYDGWFPAFGEPQLHFALSKLRAVEHRKFLIRAATSGISAVVDPVGRILVSIGVNEIQAKVAPIAWIKGQTLYSRIGNGLWYLFLLVFLVIEFIHLLRRKLLLFHLPAHFL